MQTKYLIEIHKQLSLIHSNLCLIWFYMQVMLVPQQEDLKLIFNGQDFYLMNSGLKEIWKRNKVYQYHSFAIEKMLMFLRLKLALQMV